MLQHLRGQLPSSMGMVAWIAMATITKTIHRRLKRSIAAAILSVFCFSTMAFAIDYSFIWDANEEPEVAGYKIYYTTDFPGPPYDGLHPTLPNLDSPIDVGNVTEYTIHNLDEHTVYYFVVTAYDSEGFESDYSDEVSTDYLLEDFEETKDEARFIGSASGDGGNGCFIQSTRKELPTNNYYLIACLLVSAAAILIQRGIPKKNKWQRAWCKNMLNLANTKNVIVKRMIGI